MWRQLNQAVDRACEAIGRRLGVDGVLDGWAVADPVRPAFPENGRWDEVAYWDPLPTARSITGDVGVATWEQRSWLNVPGPFYGGETDTGLYGPVYVPAHVLSSDEQYEFVYRQPLNARQVDDFMEAPGGEPMGGYAWDGDEHWTPESVRAWWRERGRVRAWIEAELAARQESCNDEEPLRAYADHLDGGGLERYLRGYLYWLVEGREPTLDEELPALAD